MLTFSVFRSSSHFTTHAFRRKGVLLRRLLTNDLHDREAPLLSPEGIAGANNGRFPASLVMTIPEAHVNREQRTNNRNNPLGTSVFNFMMQTVAASDKASSTKNRRTGIALLVGYLALYAATLLAMRREGGFAVSEPLLVLAIVGVGFSLVAWLLTIGVKSLAYSIRQPQKELAAIAVYLIPVVAFLTWGLGAIHRYIPADPGDAFALLTAKLLVLVAIPVIIMCSLFGYKLRDLTPISMRPRHLVVAVVMSIIFLGFQAALGSGLRDIAQAHLPAVKLVIGIPVVFVWLALEAGVVEEFFFRVLLQARLSAVLRSDVGGIVLMSLLFGLAHAPGLYLRSALTHEGLGAHPSFLMAAGYSIVVTSVAGFFLGVLWARTRNFAVVVLIHAAGDLLPSLLPIMHSLRLVN